MARRMRPENPSRERAWSQARHGSSSAVVSWKGLPESSAASGLDYDAVWIVLSVDVTVTDAAGVADEELEQLTPALPEPPASCSAIDALLLAVEVPVSIVALRVWVLLPTVSVQLTVTG